MISIQMLFTMKIAIVVTLLTSVSAFSINMAAFTQVSSFVVDDAISDCQGAGDETRCFYTAEWTLSNLDAFYC
jgi:hypothetical protein